ncbi:dihydroneopterin aldolase [Catenovulum sediminis]|uniref:7,8-dihydroneopterin aldolase n=1 Tax=Catenovulum sediminis TaxID=1740262 RepID=A0ABV1RM69_9ALTE|nr:dihydroneopterin aldolase [Catenovulum sediminis]
MDVVFIHNLEVKTKIGVFDWEHDIEQKLIFDIDMKWSNKIPAENDDISKALDYSTVTDFILFFCRSRQFELIETLAEELANRLMAKFLLPWIKIKITKPGAISQAHVGVLIERGTK